MIDSSLVHNIETSVKTPSIVSYQERLRARCSTEWLAAVALYQHLDREEKRERSWNLHDCRQKAWFVRHKETGRVNVVANHCGLRWCPLCANARSNFIRYSVSDWLKTADHPKFVTFTLKHSNEPLAKQVSRLYGSFRKLRKFKAFNSLVTGGIWFFQLCRNQQAGQWHPHLHCIVTGRYIPHKLLCKLWRKITLDSDIVDIRIVQDPKRVASYVARYAARPAMLSALSLRLGMELYSSMHGKRLCGKWGLFVKVSLSIQRNPDLKDWERIGSWYVVTEYARTSKNAQRILEAFENREPLPPGISLQSTDDAIDEMLGGKAVELTIDLPPPEKKLF